MRSVFEFLEVDPSRAPAWNERAVNSGVYSMTRLRLLARRHKYLLRGYPASRAHVPAAGRTGLAEGGGPVDRRTGPARARRASATTRSRLSAPDFGRGSPTTTARRRAHRSRCSDGPWRGGNDDLRSGNDAQRHHDRRAVARGQPGHRPGRRAQAGAAGAGAARGVRLRPTARGVPVLDAGVRRRRSGRARARDRPRRGRSRRSRACCSRGCAARAAARTSRAR